MKILCLVFLGWTLYSFKAFKLTSYTSMSIARLIGRYFSFYIFAAIVIIKIFLIWNLLVSFQCLCYLNIIFTFDKINVVILSFKNIINIKSYLCSCFFLTHTCIPIFLHFTSLFFISLLIMHGWDLQCNTKYEQK